MVAVAVDVSVDDGRVVSECVGLFVGVDGWVEVRVGELVVAAGVEVGDC